MSIKLGTTTIAGLSTHTISNAHTLFDFKWADHELSDMSWLRADTYSWQSGDTYTLAYNHLVQDIQGITAETETIGSYTVTFYRATDGHKICLADQEQTVLNIYNSVGIAWYYILDTTNTQFKLPRTKYGFEGLRSNVGDYITESLPNIKGSMQYCGFVTNDNAIRGIQNDSNSWAPLNGGFRFVSTTFDASRASSAYQDNAPVQERTTQMYLYFYVGEFSQSATEQTAGLNAGLFNNKADINLANVNDSAKILMSGMGMPSDTYIDLTLGASGSTYTAPADGYLYLIKSASANQHLAMFKEIDGNSILGSRTVTPVGINIASWLPVSKGDNITISYNATGSVISFKFLYAVGSESEAS